MDTGKYTTRMSPVKPYALRAYKTMKIGGTMEPSGGCRGGLTHFGAE